MTPLDPKEGVPPGDVRIKLPATPEDDRLDEESVASGVEAAETDLREAVESAEEDSAREADDPEANLDDIDHSTPEGPEGPAETDAVRRFHAP